MIRHQPIRRSSIKARSSVVLIALLCHAAAALAAGSGLGKLHQFGEWVAGCDNGRTCEAQGYGADAKDGSPIGRAVLIVRREAGPARSPVLSFGYSTLDDNATSPDDSQVVTVQVGTLRFLLPPNTSEIPPAQVPALLAAALKDDKITLSAGTKQWSVSLSGAAAALLKMDDLQGRVGTPGALVRRGTMPEAKAPAVPRVQPAQLPPTTDADRRLAPKLFAALPRDDDCPDFNHEGWQEAPLRLNSRSLLISHACFNGAYQTASRLWQVDDKAPFRARPVLLPQPDGSNSDTAVLDFMSGEDGTLSLIEAAKARGIGDCWVRRDWTWTGAQLALVSGQESPCTLFEAGGLPIGLWRTR